MTEDKFLETRGEYFHLRLMKYATTVAGMSSEDELEDIRQMDYVLSFDFEEGVYNIRWSDLVEKSKADFLDFQQTFPDIEFTDSGMDRELFITGN